MATNERDVDLIIRAKNQASKSFEQVQKAIDDLDKSQTGLNQQTGKTKDGLADLIKAVSFIGAAYEKMGTDVDRSASAYARQEKALDNLKLSYQSVIEQQKSAERVQKDLASFVGPRSKDEIKQIDLIQKAYDDLGKESQRLAQQIESGSKLTEQAFYAFQDLAGNSEKAALALAKVKKAQDDAAKSAEIAAKKESELAQQQEKTAKQAQRKSDLSVKRDMVAGLDEAKAKWKESEQAIKELSGAMRSSDNVTSDHMATLAKLQAVASANKKAYQDLQVGTELYSRALKDQSASADDMARANQNAQLVLKAVKTTQEQVDKSSVDRAASELKLAKAINQSVDAETRRSALMTKRDMVKAQQDAELAWRSAQESVKAMANEMRQSQSVTEGQKNQFEKLKQTAAIAKKSHNDLQIAVEQYTRVLRDSKSTQEQVVAAQTRAKTTLDAVSRSTENQTQQIKKNTAETRENKKANDELSQSKVRVNTSLNSLFSNNRRALSMYQQIRGQILSVTASYVGLHAAIDGVSKVIKASMDMQAAESRINVVTGGNMALTAREMAWVESESKRLGFSMSTLSSEWSKFAVSAQASNFTLGETRKIFTSVSEAGRVLKLDSVQIERSFVALTQMMSKGTIQMEELRQQLGEHIPGAFALMARAAGVSGAELTKMMEQGQLTSDYLIKFADVLDQQFGGQLSKSLEMTQAEIGRFQTAVFLALNKIAEAGVLDSFTRALREITEILDSAEADVWFERIGAAAGGLIDILVVLAQNLDLILAILGAIGASKVIKWVHSFVKSVLALRTSLMAASAATAAVGTAAGAAAGGVGGVTVAVRVLGVAIGALAGPIGIAASLLVGLGVLWASKVSEARKTTAQAKRTVDEFSEAYLKSAGNIKEWGDIISGMDMSQLKKELDSLKAVHEKTVKSLTTPFSPALIASLQGSEIQSIALEINRLISEVRSGEKPVQDLVDRLEEIGQTEPSLKKITEALLKNAKSALDAEGDVKRYEAMLRVMANTADDADYALLKIPSSIDDISDAAEAGAVALRKYTQAMAAMAKMVPELKIMTEHEAELKSIETQYRKALEGAGDDAEEIAKAQEIRDKAMRNAAISHNQAMAKVFAENKKGQDDFLIAFEKLTTKPGQFKFVDEKDADLIDRLSDASERIGTVVGSRWKDIPNEVKANILVAWEHTDNPTKELADVIKTVKTGKIEQIADSLQKVAGGKWAPEASSIRGYKGDISDLQLEMDLNKERGKKRGKTPEQKEADLVAKTIKSYQDKIAVIDKTGFELELYNATIAKGISLESKHGQKIKESVSDWWKATEAKRESEKAEKKVNTLLEMRREIMQQIQFANENDRPELRDAMVAQLGRVNEQLKESVEHAIKFVTALGGEGMDAALLKLQGVKISIEDIGENMLDAKQVNEMFAAGATDAFVSITEAAYNWAAGIQSGKDALIDMQNAFLKFVADFLMQIARMIIQQMIFNMIAYGSPTAPPGAGAAGAAGGGAGGLGGFLSGIFGKAHGGGVVGALGSSSKVSSLVFAGATRYHTGGIAGLKPNEVPTILERGEEVLTRDDPRHILQGGAAGGSQTNFRIIAVDDERSAIDEALRTPEGEKAVITFMKRNSKTIRQIVS